MQVIGRKLGHLDLEYAFFTIKGNVCWANNCSSNPPCSVATILSRLQHLGCGRLRMIPLFFPTVPYTVCIDKCGTVDFIMKGLHHQPLGRRWKPQEIFRRNLLPSPRTLTARRRQRPNHRYHLASPFRRRP